ncbi:MAG: S41 family peptidase [Brumimicrobium sp.]
MRNTFLILTILFFASCEKMLFKPDLASSDPYENFDYLWSEVDKKYSYFELKGINWNEVKDQYRPMLSDNSSETELFEVMAKMLNELKDDHSNLISPFNISQYKVALTGSENFRWRTIEEHYLPDIWTTGPLLNDFLSNEEVGYIRYASFTSNFSNAQMDLVLNRFKNTKGIILDLRKNGGGSIFNYPKILGRFVDTKTLVGHNISRNGPNHDDFAEKEDIYITPYDGVKYSKPVIVLIDKGSYSATTFFALATKAIPNITLMGDTTAGGGGLPNGGQLPNGWTYRFSVSQLLDLNGNNYAENGVPADIEVDFDWSDLTKDEILDKAIDEIVN